MSKTARAHRGVIAERCNVRLVARPGSVSLDRVAQQYARAVTGIATDQLWAALRQWGAATLTGREGL